MLFVTTLLDAPAADSIHFTVNVSIYSHNAPVYVTKSIFFCVSLLFFPPSKVYRLLHRWHTEKSAERSFLFRLQKNDCVPLPGQLCRKVWERNEKASTPDIPPHLTYFIFLTSDIKYRGAENTDADEKAPRPQQQIWCCLSRIWKDLCAVNYFAHQCTEEEML